MIWTWNELAMEQQPQVVAEMGVLTQLDGLDKIYLAFRQLDIYLHPPNGTKW